MIVVYSGDNCPRCVEVKKYLDNKDVEYKEVNVRKDAEALTFLKSLGFTSIPQVFKDNEWLCGYEKYKEVL